MGLHVDFKVVIDNFSQHCGDADEVDSKMIRTFKSLFIPYGTLPRMPFRFPPSLVVILAYIFR